LIRDVDLRAQELVDGLLAEPWGQVSPSVYETGRLVAFTPWLAGHAERVAFLLRTQRPDGAWGPDGEPGYLLVPSLSAIDALLAEGSAEAVAAARRGLDRMRPLLAALPPLPDTPAIELISASLIRSVDSRLPGALPAPAALDDGTLDLVIAAAKQGGPLPQKMWHALEIIGPAAAGLPGVPVESMGGVGASPAATAAWLGRAEPPPSDPSRRFLETAARQHGGPVACGLPITVFERSWVLTLLNRAGLAFDPHPELLLSLSEPLGPDGVATGPGLPPDADTTSAVLYALTLLGRRVAPDPLTGYETETNFSTWTGGEQGRSVTTNAHVLEAFGQYARLEPGAGHEATAAKVAAWLRHVQRADGSWTDRWHVSPYYATMAAALALAEFGGEDSADSVRAAVRWVRGTQRPDGSWGVWGGTAEESAYALHVLLLAGEPEDAAEAVRAGAGFLEEASDGEPPALWHDKDLYLPIAIVRAAVLAASHLARVQLGGTLVT